MTTNNRFSRTQSRVLVYGEGQRYKVIDCNNLEAVEETIKFFGKPNVYMKNFNTWQELAAARKCYEWQMSALPKAKQDVEKPTDEEEDWFWQKQLDDEYMVRDIKDIVEKYDTKLPDKPDVYLSSKEILKNENLAHKKLY